MHRNWLILPFLLANTDMKEWSHKHILAILTPSCMQIPYECNILFSLGHKCSWDASPSLLHVYGSCYQPPPPSHTPAQVLIQVLLREVGSWSLISSDLEPFTTHTGSWLFKKMMMELLGGFKLPWLFDIFGIRKINSLDHPHQLKFELSSWESIPLLTILTSKGQYLFCSWAIGTSGSCISSLSLVDFLLWGFGNFLSYTRRLWQPQRRWITILAGL